MKTKKAKASNPGILNIFLNGYLVLTGWLIPLYLADGYVGAGERKSLLYIFCALILALLCLVIAGKRLFADLKGILSRLVQKKAGAADLLITVLLLSALTHILTFSLSKYKNAAVIGINGWRMGLVPQLLFLFFAVLFVLYYKITDTAWYILFGGELVTLAFGVLNRLGIYPIRGTDVGMHYISTVGNIDWYLTYLSVLYPLSIGVLLQVWDHRAKNRTGLKRMLIAVVLLSQWVLIVLGTEASLIVLVLPAVFFIIPAVRTGCRELILFVLAGTGCMAELSWAVRVLDGGNRWNDIFSPGNPITFFVRFHGGAALAAAAAAAWMCLKKRKEVPALCSKKLSGVQTAVTAAFLCMPVLLLFTQVFLPGLWPDSFGNGRGYIWHISADALKLLKPGAKVFGTGQDTMGIVIAELADSAELAVRYGAAVLVNAHSLLLNKLIEAGIAGVLLFFAIMICSLYCLKKVRDISADARAAALGCAIVCYFLLEAIMFEQVAAAPLFYVMIGLAGAAAGEYGRRHG